MLMTHANLLAGVNKLGFVPANAVLFQGLFQRNTYKSRTYDSLFQQMVLGGTSANPYRIRLRRLFIYILL